MILGDVELAYDRGKERGSACIPKQPRGTAEQPEGVIKIKASMGECSEIGQEKKEG